MYCKNCGGKVPEDVKFCPMCGTEVTNEIKNKKRMVPFVIAGAVGAVLIIGLVILFINRKPTINLNDYLEVEVSGYDTMGKVSYDFDEAALKEDYGEIIEKNMDKEMINSFGMGKYAKSIGVQALIMNCIDGSFDKRSELCNGDTVTFSWDCEDEIAKESYGVRLKYSDVVVKVEDLEVLNVVNPFEGVTVAFSGAEPNVKAEIVYENKDSENEMFSFGLTENEYLSNGDTVTLKIRDMRDDEYYAKKYGVYLSETSKEYIVENMPRYLLEADDVNTEVMQHLLNEAEEILSQEMGVYEYIYDKNYWYANSSVGGEKINRLYLLYQVRKQEMVLEQQQIVYFEDVMIDADGNVCYEKSDSITSRDPINYMKKENVGNGFNIQEENIGNILSEVESLEEMAQQETGNSELEKQQEEMFEVLDALASSCYREAYDSNNAEFFWSAVSTLIAYNPDLGERGSDSCSLFVEQSMLEKYATGLFEDYSGLLEIPEAYYSVEQISDDKYKFFCGDRGLTYSRMTSWTENGDGTYSVIVESVDELEDEVYATYKFTLVENPHALNKEEQVYPYSVRYVEKLD